MNPDNYGIVEMVLSFGLILAFCVWQLISVNRLIRRRNETEAAGKKGGE